jgi:SAM-dependent methyltransferase
MTTTLAPRIDEPAYFDRLADVEARHWWAFGMWRLASYWLDEALRDRTCLCALDIGCGTGLTARRMASRPEIREVVGVDPSSDALAIASGRHAGPLVRGSALALPFDSEQFDVATCCDVFQHLPDGGDRRAALEIQRVLKPGGVAVIRANGRGWSGDDASYRLNDLVSILRAAGLHIVQASYANALPALMQETRGGLAALLRPRLASDAPPSHPSGGGLQIRVPRPAINRLMARVSGLEAWLAGRLRVPLPFGHSTLVLVERPFVGSAVRTIREKSGPHSGSH